MIYPHTCTWRSRVRVHDSSGLPASNTTTEYAGIRCHLQISSGGEAIEHGRMNATKRARVFLPREQSGVVLNVNVNDTLVISGVEWEVKGRSITEVPMAQFQVLDVERDGA